MCCARFRQTLLAGPAGHLVHCRCRGLGVRLHDGDPEDPDRLPRVRRLLGRESRAGAARAGDAEGDRARAAASSALASTAAPPAPARPARFTDARLRPHETSVAPVVSTGPIADSRPGDAIAGLPAAFSLAASLI